MARSHRMGPAGVQNITWTPLPLTSCRPVIQPLQLLAWLNDGARHAECVQVHKVQLDAVDHLIWCMSFQSTHQCPIPSICCGPENFHSETLAGQSCGMPYFGKCPNCTLSHTIRGKYV